MNVLDVLCLFFGILLIVYGVGSVVLTAVDAHQATLATDDEEGDR